MADIFGAPPGPDVKLVEVAGKSVDLRKDPHLVLRGPMDHTTIKDPKDKPYGMGDKNDWNEGFHTFAFGNMAEGACLPGWEPLPMVSSKNTRTPDMSLDPRVTRWERVKAYALEVSQVGTEERLSKKSSDID